MGYKMVFSDMDGTLLWKGVRVSVENSAAIRKAVDKGVEFVICTGRGVFGGIASSGQKGLCYLPEWCGGV